MLARNMVMRRAQEKDDVEVALHDVVAMLEWELQRWEGRQQQTNLGGVQMRLWSATDDVWTGRAEEVVRTAAAALDAETCRTDMRSIRSACIYAVRKAVEGLSSEAQGRARIN